MNAPAPRAMSTKRALLLGAVIAAVIVSAVYGLMKGFGVDFWGADR